MHTHVHRTGGSAGHFTVTLTHMHAHMCIGQYGSAGHFTVTPTTHAYTHMRTPIYTRWECKALYSNTNKTRLYTPARTHDVHPTGGEAWL